MTLNLFCEKCNIGYILDDSLANRSVTCPRCGSALQDEVIPVVEVLDEDAEKSPPVIASRNQADVVTQSKRQEVNAAAMLAPRPANKLVLALGTSVLLLAGTLSLILGWYFLSGSKVTATNSTQNPTNQVSQVRPEADLPTSEEAETSASPETPSKKSTASNLDEVKASTVYIRSVSRDGIGMGSGFLAHAYENRGLIVTNAHVVESDDNSVPRIQCVFNAGQRGEFTVDAKILALDSKVDIAVLEVTHNYLPKPLDYAGRIDFKETMPGFVLGYPFGENLATNDRSPAITVSSCKITSLRRDEFDQIRMLQVDGGINPGNSGGPMVSEDGVLVGIAVAKVSNTEIGFVIPQTELQSFMAGRATTFAVNEVTPLASRISYAVTVGIVDPLEQITDAILMGFENIEREIPDSDGQWKLIQRPALFSVPFAINRSPTAEKLNQTQVTFEIPNDSKHVGAQIQIKHKDGSEWYSPIHVLPNEFKRPRVLADKSKSDPGEHSTVDVVFANPFADFCLNPSNGEIAAVDPMKNVAVRFTREQLKNPEGDPPSELKVGGLPSAIVFKQFNNSSYYLVLCRQDSHIFVINAEDFSLVRKIPIESMGGNCLCASQRADDPFVYYNFGAPKLELGVINLRKLTDSGRIRKAAEDCTVSADGTVLYLQRTESDIESYTITNNSQFDLPQLFPISVGQRSNCACCADCLGEFAAFGDLIFDKKMTKYIATLNALPACFFRERPVVIGAVESTIQPFSTNTFKPIGRRIELKNLSSASRPVIPPIRSFEMIQTVPIKSRVFADEVNNQVIVAVGKYLTIVPMSAFDMPKEPLLALEVGKTDFKVGQSATLLLKLKDPRAKLVLADLPAGSKQRPNGIEWIPNDDQVGIHTIQARVSIESVTKQYAIELNVSQPYLSTNFQIADFDLDPTNSFICCWGQASSYAQTGDPRDKPVEQTSQLAILPLRSGFVAHQKTVSGIRQAKYSHPYLAVLPDNDHKRVDLYRVPSFDRAKSFIAKSQVAGVIFSGDKILVQAGSDSKSYSLTTFDPSPEVNEQSSIIPVREGLLRDGVLYDFVDKPVLIVDPGKIPQLGEAHKRPFLETLHREHPGITINSLTTMEATVSVSGPQPLMKTDLYASIESTIRRQFATDDDRLGGIRYDIDILIQDSKPTLLTRLPIVKRIYRDGIRELPPKIRVANEHVFVSFDSSIYRWSPNAQKLAALKSQEPARLQIVPKQSMFLLSQPTAPLNHEVRGGEPPCEFILMGMNEEMELNSQNGTLQINKDKLTSSLKKSLLNITSNKTDSKVVAEKLGPVKKAGISQVEKIVGARPDGLPMALPVHFKVLDNRGTAAELLYFVIVVFSQNEVDKALSTK